ncbi:polypeptide N-acetylgalactosaminyltransferase 15-like isoform X1 [Acipenser ruthenus]|uniref:polypeptide N-acetylgalactosaminyltransferase 15-like isoform X1 n=1 Tax=Acipenser ruthenus TaxID=7906 RepID=UPI00145AD4BE|nr:polypeptide N-acetylgalactosaminyltransferase 15-like isoform X1 [Acipenser ruthenus]
MTFRKRCRFKLCRLPFLFFWLLLGFFLMIVTHLDPLFGEFKEPAAAWHERVVGQPDFEEILEARDQLEMDGLSPLKKSFKEDQLIIVPSKFKRKANDVKKGNYKFVKPGSGKKGEKSTAVLGDLGKPVHLKLDGFEKDTEESGLAKHGFNEAVSERISLHRRLPEVRHPLCLHQQYNRKLPTASVIICFHNEAWSTLLRTIHSVLDTAPKNLLKEVILVDDLSQQGHLKTALSEYISRLDGVKLIRSNKRLGVIGGRLLGAARASGDVLVFMDSHCECHKGWLEPLLDRIAGDRSRVVSPVLDVIDWKTFQYYHSVDPQRGVFDWKLDFHWEPVPKYEKKQHGSLVSPVRSPALPGGVLAVERHYFQNIGAYDPGMSIWGVENMELSIRVWLCGGSLEILPCSRVGHLYHHRVPYSLPDEETVVKNKIRVAETWLDSFKNIFYKRDMAAYLIGKAEAPNCTERVQLSRRLGCKNFHWFLSNIHPELYIPEDRRGFSGELYNVGTGYCADYKTRWGAAGDPVQLSPCSGNGNQHSEYNSMKEIRFGSGGQFCFDVRQEQVIVSECTLQEQPHFRQQWEVRQQSGGIAHILTAKCIEAVKSGASLGLFLRPCSPVARQQWHFEQLIVMNEG